MLTIPRAPARLALDIRRYWNGAPCPDARLHGRVELTADAEGLSITASLPHQPAPRIPRAPRGTRVADLWKHDVVECFLVGAGGRYLEVELGAGGHFLVLSFTAPRELADAHEALVLPIDFASDSRGWRSRARLGWELVPPRLAALNAFVIASGSHLACTPVPGPEPDFHQPARFPRGALEVESRPSRTRPGR
jgi:hypothetical protein